MINPFELPSVPPRIEREQSVEKKEEIKLRFQEIYKSPEWKALPGVDREQLLLVAEGAKPGAIIEGNFTDFQKIVERMGLATHLNTSPQKLEPVYEVAPPDVLAQRYRDFVSLPEKAPEGEGHRINGRFLGYPPCCTEEYVHPTKNRDAITREYGKKKQEEMCNVDYEVKKLIEQGKLYPEELDYRPPAFTPCSATCPHALSVLGKWKKILDHADPEGAKELRHFNWQEEPYHSVHRAEIEKANEEELKEENLRFLRGSAGTKE